MSVHKCIAEIDAKLAPHNAQIARGWAIGEGECPTKYFVATEKVDQDKRSKKAPLVAMSFCPFCGEELS